MARTFRRQLALVFVRAIHLNFEGSPRAVTGLELQVLGLAVVDCALAVVNWELTREKKIAVTKIVGRCFLNIPIPLIFASRFRLFTAIAIDFLVLNFIDLATSHQVNLSSFD